jgi:hypothetical protein
MLSARPGSWLSWGVVAVATACTLTDTWEPSGIGPAGDGGSSGSGQGGSSGGGGSGQSGGTGDGLGGTNFAGSGGAGSAGSGGAAGSGGTAVDAGSEPPDAGEPPPTCAGLTFGASCYEFVAQTVTWDVAEAACVQRNGHLASVESIGEDTFLAAWPQTLGIPANDSSGIWLGATDAVADNDFRWPDNAPLTFTHWGMSQPDNGGGAPDCIEKRNEATASWYDQRCTDLKPYICERPL